MSGLDPAFPLYEDLDGKETIEKDNSLDKGDALFVDVRWNWRYCCIIFRSITHISEFLLIYQVLHCNMYFPDAPGVIYFGRYGTRVERGHADFYPNGGEKQADCPFVKETCTFRNSKSFNTSLSMRHACL
jgi:hypothetical protein